MYVFQPGAGFSGECRKVAPADDFKLSWSEGSEISPNASNDNVLESELSGAVGGECHRNMSLPCCSDVVPKTSNR